MSDAHKTAEASAENLRRIFTVPEAPDSTLARLEAEIARNLQGFLNERIVATQRSLADIEADFGDARIPEQPVFVSEQADFLLRRACTIGQGYYYSPPLPAAEFDAFVRSYRPRPADRFAA